MQQNKPASSPDLLASPSSSLLMVVRMSPGLLSGDYLVGSLQWKYRSWLHAKVPITVVCYGNYSWYAELKDKFQCVHQSLLMKDSCRLLLCCDCSAWRIILILTTEKCLTCKWYNMLSIEPRCFMFSYKILAGCTSKSWIVYTYTCFTCSSLLRIL